MQTVPHLTVDLQAPPAQRWRFDAAQTRQARALLDAYERDLGLARTAADLLVDTLDAMLPADLREEHDAVAAALAVPRRQVLLASGYYDAMKAVLGCSAFAVDHGDGVLHGRNLDWWTADGLLRDATLVTRFVGAPAGEFTTVGWPGFLGVFSAVAKGRFAVTLNSVLSDEPPQVAFPVVLLLRQVLATAPDFAAAVATLAATPIPCDCLLLVTGIRRGERVVIERTPGRHALRHAAGPLVVTNDYRQLGASGGGTASDSPIAATSCGRYDALQAELGQAPPRELAACLRPLAQPAVRMTITVQHMAFDARSGAYAVQLPPPA